MSHAGGPDSPSQAVSGASRLPLLSTAALLAITAVWGVSFVWVRDSVAVYPVFPFLAVRFTLGALVLLPFLGPRLSHTDRGALLGGFWMGLALFFGYAFQTMGLLFTSALHSGFITGLFVVLTPVFQALWLRRAPRLAVTAAVLLASSGLFLLSFAGGLEGLNRGDLLSLICAAVYAVHLLVTGHQARRHDTGVLVLAQLVTVAGLAWLASIPRLGKIWPIPSAAAWGIVLTALLATALAYLVQTTCQRYVSAVQTALIFTMEPVFAGLFAVWVGGETLGLRGLLGGGLIVAGMLWGQLFERK